MLLNRINVLNKSWIVLVLFSSIGTLHAQSYDDDLKEISNKIESSDFLHLIADVTVYSSKGGRSIYNLSTSIKYSKQDGMITQMGKINILKNNNYEVHINDVDKTVFVHKTHHYKPEDFSQKSIKELKKILEGEMSASGEVNVKKEFLSDVKGIRTYRLTNIPGFKEMVVVLDMNNKNIRQVSYQYSKTGDQNGRYCVLDYETFNYNPKFDLAEFKLRTYCAITGDNTYRLSSRFNNYKLLQE
ncbi:MAG: hypothetical protein MK105_04815 [Crocinitomicaceae bacterium]|nr:hypothetical protein [Crocinitomicaceae bacterium]